MRGSLGIGSVLLALTLFHPAYAGPTLEPLAPACAIASEPSLTVIASDATPYATTYAAPVVGAPSFEMLEALDEPTVVVPDVTMAVPEIPLPPALIPLVAGIAVVARKVCTRRAPDA